MRAKLQDVAALAGVPQEVIDRAEDLVGHGKLMTDFGIHLIFSIDGRSVVDAVRSKRDQL